RLRLVGAGVTDIARTGALDLHQLTRTSLRQPSFCHQPVDRSSPVPRAYHFFETRSFSASMSSTCCATVFFSGVFSASSSRKRCSSLVSNPPYLLRQR